MRRHARTSSIHQDPKQLQAPNPHTTEVLLRFPPVRTLARRAVLAQVAVANAVTPRRFLRSVSPAAGVSYLLVRGGALAFCLSGKARFCHLRATIPILSVVV